MNNETIQTSIIINEKTLEHNRAKDLEFIAVTFMMVLIILIPINYLLKRRQRLLNQSKKINELHIAFIVVAHLIFYILLGLVIFPPLMELITIFIKSQYVVYITFPLYIFFLSKISLHSLNHYIDKASIQNENNRLKIIIFSLILLLIFTALVYKIIWGIFGFSYGSLFYGLLFLIGFYFMLNRYFQVQNINKN